MPNIAKLAAKLMADDKGFVSPVARAAKAVERLSDRVSQVDAALKRSGRGGEFAASAARNAAAIEKQAQAAEKSAKTSEKAAAGGLTLGRAFGAAKALIAAAGVAMAAHYVTSVVSAQIETLKFARSIGDSVDSVNAIKQAIRDVGGPVEAANNGLLTLARTLSAATSGNGAAADTFARLGLDAEKLSRMKPSAAFREVAEALSKIENAEKRAALAVQIFGEDAAALLPVLSQGAAGLDAAAAKAERLGQNIGDAKLSALEQAQIKWESIKTTIEGVALQVAANLLPYIQGAIDAFGGCEAAGASVGQVVEKVFSFAGTAIGHVIDAADLLRIGLELVRGGWVKIGEAVLWCVREGVANVKNLIEAVGLSSDALNDLLSIVGNTKEEFRDWAKESATAAREMVANFGRGERFAKSLEGLGKRAEEAGKLADAAARVGDSLRRVNTDKELFNRGLAVVAEQQTPLEKFNNTIAELERLLASGSIGWDTYARAAAGAVNELQSAHQLQKLGFSSAVSAGSTAAYSTIVASNQQEDQRVRETPQDRTNRILNESKEIERQQLQWQKKTAEAVANLKVARLNGG